jgi:hypothetical protein
VETSDLVDINLNTGMTTALHTARTKIPMACEILAEKFELLTRSMRRFYWQEFVGRVEELEIAHQEKLVRDETTCEIVYDLTWNISQNFKYESMDMLRGFRIFDNVCNWVGNFRLCFLAKMYIVKLRGERLRARQKHLENFLIIFKGIFNNKKNQMAQAGLETLVRSGYNGWYREQLMIELFNKRLQDEEKWLLVKQREFFVRSKQTGKLDRLCGIFQKKVVNRYFQGIFETCSDLFFNDCNESEIKVYSDLAGGMEQRDSTIPKVGKFGFGSNGKIVQSLDGKNCQRQDGMISVPVPFDIPNAQKQSARGPNGNGDEGDQKLVFDQKSPERMQIKDINRLQSTLDHYDKLERD